MKYFYRVLFFIGIIFFSSGVLYGLIGFLNAMEWTGNPQITNAVIVAKKRSVKSSLIVSTAASACNRRYSIVVDRDFWEKVNCYEKITIKHWCSWPRIAFVNDRDAEERAKIRLIFLFVCSIFVAIVCLICFLGSFDRNLIKYF